MESGVLPRRRRVACAALVAILASAIGIAPALIADAGASGAGLDTGLRGGPEGDVEQSLELFVSRSPEAYERASIRAEGFAESPLELWVYEDLRGRACSATPAGRTSRTRLVFGGLEVNGAFAAARFLRMRKPGRHTYCAYLGPDENTAFSVLGVARQIRRPLLRAGRARRTVATALRRHGFAGHVVASLKRGCDRLTRSKFQCRFSSAFPGYRLNGSGPVGLKERLSYRFQVSAQGRTFVLTDENEGRLLG
jgi:hypothetical protein